MNDRMRWLKPCNVGDRIRLDHMGPDPFPIRVGSVGTVLSVRPSVHTNDWQVAVSWDNGRSLSLICPPDRLTVIEGGAP